MVAEGGKAISEEKARRIATLTKDAVEKLWKKVQERWPECFDEPKRYNLLRGFGVSVIHRLFENCINEDGGFTPEEMLENAQICFIQYLRKTDIEAEEWMVGGAFTGYSSEQGYGVIVNLLQGKKTLNELEE